MARMGSVGATIGLLVGLAAGCVVTQTPPPSGPANVGAPIAGVWHWFTGPDVVINADGTFVGSPNSGRWSLLDPQRQVYRLVWSHEFIDTLTLSADGNHLGGSNQNGAHVTADRI
jgi:hypothetical protein